MRSVQMRTQPSGPSPFESSFSPGQEHGHNIEADERPCSYIKSLVDERDDHIVEECPKSSISELDNREKSCRVLNMNLKGDEPED